MNLHMRQLKVPEQFGLLFCCPVLEQTHKAEHEKAYQLLQESVRIYAEQKKLLLPESLQIAFHEKGKPYFQNMPEIYFNLSHCKGMAVCLLSGEECGADVEQKREIRPLVLKKVFSPEEQAFIMQSKDPALYFTKFWTLKESYVKAIGTGIAFPLRKVNFSFTQEQIICNQNAVFFQIQESDYSISVCSLKVQ